MIVEKGRKGGSAGGREEVAFAEGPVAVTKKGKEVEEKGQKSTFLIFKGFS